MLGQEFVDKPWEHVEWAFHNQPVFYSQDGLLGCDPL